MGDIKFSVFSKGGEQRSAQAVGIWRKYFLCSNQAETSPHESWMKFSEDYFSRRDLFLWITAKPALDLGFSQIGCADFCL
jgi:hypothetical protein